MFTLKLKRYKRGVAAREALRVPFSAGLAGIEPSMLWLLFPDVQLLRLIELVDGANFLLLRDF